MAFRRIGEIGPGPLFPPAGTTSSSGSSAASAASSLELIAFVLVTVLLPVLLLAALLVDLVLRDHPRQADGRHPARRLPLVLPATEVWAMVVLLVIWLGGGGPFGKGSMRRRRGIYWLRPRWARSHLGTIRALFGITFEIEGGEAALPGRS